MNILFYTYGKIHATKGGTERATISVATALSHYYNCRCFSIYELEALTAKEECFINEYVWKVTSDWNDNIHRLRHIIDVENIDIIVIQGAFAYVKYFRDAVRNLKCKLVFAHHFEPGAEALFFSFPKQLMNLTHSKNVTEFLRYLKNLIFFPRLQRIFVKSLRQAYYDTYKYSDRVVLLSSGFIKPFQKYGQFDDETNFSIIPNSLSFNESVCNDDLKLKQKKVLIVSRMDETHKRLSLALKIWKKVKDNSISNGWSLELVGEGPSLSSYKRLVKKQHIPDVIFHGRTNPEDFYRSSSIFLMTSRSESWGLTLTEAQQFGVVPIAFNTYTSLVDIVFNQVNGIVVPEGNIHSYVDSLLDLMNDDDKRYKMQLQGMKDCRRFSQETIAKQWWNLFKDL